jgi:poly(hydroxyalkanoate) depolymerase family esterase
MAIASLTQIEAKPLARHLAISGCLSIREMVEHAVAKFAVDRHKVFVTGLSAGGAMASVMLATYPEVFAGGAIIAGLPYGCAGNVQQAF